MGTDPEEQQVNISNEIHVNIDGVDDEIVDEVIMMTEALFHCSILQ